MKKSLLTVSLALAVGWFARAEPEKVNPNGTSNTKSEEIGKILKEMGYEPVALSPIVYQVSIDREGWKVHIMVSLSREADRIWLESRFAPIEQPDLVPSKAWRTLLEENEVVGPAHFSFDKSDKRIHLYKPFEHHGLTVNRFKTELDQFDATVRRTYTIWRAENFASAESILASPRVVEVPFDETAFLKGTWRIVRIEAQGKSITEEKLSFSHPQVVFEGERAIIKTGLEPERKVTIKIDPKQNPMQIDFIDDKKRVEAGIYDFQRGLLKVCVAGNGEERPRQFATDAKNKTWMLVLKREE